MSFFLTRYACLARTSSFSAAPLRPTIRHISQETSGAINSPIGLSAGPWDPNNRVRVVGAALGVLGACGMLFDTFYRRATKGELNEAMNKFETKFDREMGKLESRMGKLESKIDGLTNALLQNHQTENGELRREIERLKKQGT